MSADPPRPGRKGPQRKKGKKPRKGASGGKASLSDMIEKGKKVFRLLTHLHRELTPQKGESRREPAGGRDGIVLRFNPEGDPADFAGDLIDAFRSSQGDERNLPAFVEGRVYCYQCDSPVCAHSVPPHHLSVFTGYTPTGFPLWEEFSQVLLEKKDPRIDDLLQEDPLIVAHCQGGEELKVEQLKIFGRESALYDVWGQVLAGYLPFPRSGNGGRTAATFQAVKCLTRSRFTLRLNVISRLPGGEDLVDYLRAEPETELEGLLASTRKRLDDLARTVRARRDPRGDNYSERVLPILRRLARGVERGYRRRRRRTHHARVRRADRPAVGMALKDAKKTGPDRFFFDEKHHTMIVVGPKWRIHVFSREGRHVTSMNLDKERVQKRLDTRRWRYANPAEIQEIKSKLAALERDEDTPR